MGPEGGFEPLELDGADVPGDAGFIGPDGGFAPLGVDGVPGAVAGFFNPSFSRIFVKTLMVTSFR